MDPIQNHHLLLKSLYLVVIILLMTSNSLWKKYSVPLLDPFNKWGDIGV